MSNASNETEWAADRKVGFAMGILLVGVVAALFFRNEPLVITDAPTVAREELIDSRLRDRNVEVYVDEPEPQQAPTEDVWKNSEFLADYLEQDSGVALPIAPLTAATPRPDNDDVPVPRPRSRADIRPPAIVKLDDSAPEDVAEAAELPELADLPKAELPTLPQEHFDEYIIRYGDTLSGIAEKMLGSPSRYTDIYHANKDRMASPDRLRVGTAIRIPRH